MHKLILSHLQILSIPWKTTIVFKITTTIIMMVMMMMMITLLVRKGLSFNHQFNNKNNISRAIILIKMMTMRWKIPKLPIKERHLFSSNPVVLIITSSPLKKYPIMKSEFFLLVKMRLLHYSLWFFYIY